MVVLGSGGHTAEMLALMRGFDLETYAPRCWVVAATDTMSGAKAVAFEQEMAAQAAAAAPADAGPPPHAQPQPVRRSPRKQAARRPTVLPPGDDRKGSDRWAGSAQQAAQQQRGAGYSVVTVPRSREVGQSFRSSVWTTLRALCAALRVVFASRPDLLLTNGPGTALPLCCAALLVRALGVASCRVVYVESIARVYRLSLTGKILYRLRLADAFLVQWEELAAAHPRATFAGRLM